MRRLVITQSPGPDFVRLHPTGRLDHDTAPGLERAIDKALRERGRALVDLDDLDVDQPSRAMVFPAALAESGGWPQSRLVLHGGSDQTVRVLATAGVTNTVPHATSARTAVRLLTVRPPVVRKRACFDQQPTAPALARSFVAETCTSWHIADTTAYWAQVVISELVTNAVEHARTACRVVAEYTGTALRLSAHDDSPLPPRPQPQSLTAEHGRGLHIVSELTDHWGVYQRNDYKVTWAVLSATDDHRSGPHEDQH